MENQKQIAALIANAKEALGEFSSYSQEELDAIVQTIAKTIYDNAELLAREAVDETKMGVYEDKVAKNRGKSKTIYHHIRNKKTVGIIDQDEKEGLIYVAHPVGVVAAVTPTTNPIVTPMCNAMFAIKGGNPIIIAPHPRSQGCSSHTVDLMNEAIVKKGIRCPKNAIQIIRDSSIEKTDLLMKNVDVVIATGGMGLVKAAYSSGHPSFGVGAGNVQVIVDEDVNLEEALAKIIAGRKFDNGIICSGEQSIIAPRSKWEKVLKAAEKAHGFYIEDDAQVEKFRHVLFENGMISKHVVGQSVQTIARLAGVCVPEETHVIILKAKGAGDQDILCKEKMCPVMIALPYDTFEEAVEIAKANLLLEGAGHSAAIHSHNQQHIRYAGEHLIVSRLIVNAPSSVTAGGSLANGLSPTTTLGCGTRGGNSISENLTWKHLINISRIAMPLSDKPIPTDEEIWAD